MGIVKEHNNENEVLDERVEVVEEKSTVTSENKKEKKVKKDKKPRENKLGRKIKETTSELKKVSWPSFKEVLKRTAIVVGFVLIATVILFGIDELLQFIYKLLILNY